MFANYSRTHSNALLGFGTFHISLGSAVNHLCNPLDPEAAEGDIPLCRVATGSFQEADTVEREPLLDSTHLRRQKGKMSQCVLDSSGE